MSVAVLGVSLCSLGSVALNTEKEIYRYLKQTDASSLARLWVKLNGVREGRLKGIMDMMDMSLIIV